MSFRARAATFRSANWGMRRHSSLGTSGLAPAFYLSDFNAEFRNYVTLFIAVAVIILIVTVATAWFIARGIRRPITSMTATLQELAADNTDVVVDGTSRQDEIGAMARAAGEIGRASGRERVCQYV